MALVSDILYNSRFQYQYEDVDNIPQEDNECFICKEPYHNAADDNSQSRYDPIKLGCGHIVGKQCFDEWRVYSGRAERYVVCDRGLLAPLSCPVASLLYYISSSF
ncbi:hypothetical protein K491DRAFT_673331 [Lophiostoma macrostomum CBS 122681]|uniref:Zinc finger RING-type eukaryotic domain-containing protein n=1 Tax=Lophiostoma macrostomum CBS 122681 TaxID=1314788 RepID=A0A6A6TTG5_9PLEO|nr:hypothetical protein K491DRAFT_673331 [Lophiostoma macrostomum CBS 122681]